jgi:alkanesulfonate monooxygenase
VSIEFIGMIQTRKVSEIHAPQDPVIDIGYAEQFARAHEAASFDRILVPHHSTSPDALLTIAHAASVTSRTVRGA